MARMIPSFVDEHTPPGECDVFNRLVDGPEDWLILHSLDLAPWNKNKRTEIDFVVVIPDTGILCIEVKSHVNITYDGECWHPHEIKRSPFKQASDGRHAFYRRLKELTPCFQHVPVAHCCIFPRARFEVKQNLSVSPLELIDASIFKTLSSPVSFCIELKVRLTKYIDLDPVLYPLSNPLSSYDLDTLIELSVPVQKRRPDSREEIRQREEDIENILLEQQKPVLQLAELNERLIISGGAGTGKTLIAMELAQRMSEKGHRVALLCFNRIVGDWMKQHITDSGPVLPNLIIGRAIRIMAELTNVKIPDNPTSAFWENELPDLIEDRLTDPDLEATASFDYLVLDEAQDILGRPRLWQCLIQFLRGGLETGTFTLFGDFDHQVLKDHERMKSELKSLATSALPVRWNLSENCRNYQIVGETALQLSGFSDTVYSAYRRARGGRHNYNIFFYESANEQLVQIKKWIHYFKKMGYRKSEITLLSFRNNEASAAASLKNEGYNISPAWQSGEGISCASIHAFKGMENKIIILTDVVLTDHEFHRDLFYTGMTRATESVRVLCDMNSQKMLSCWLAGKVQK